MLQKQYYTYKLSKTQIDHILANYNIKYTTMKIEIESKLTNMIQVFLKDIFACKSATNKFLDLQKIIVEAGYTSFDLS